MKQNGELLGQIQIELRDSVEYQASIEMIINLVNQLNEAGRFGEAMQAQQLIIDLTALRSQVLSVPNPGFTFMGGKFSATR